ncbi:DNA-binding response regulator, partial [Klebsiella pneumoniae]|nr:DNA-binding response regulator [Klebsiella pneumoniae]
MSSQPGSKMKILIVEDEIKTGEYL